MTNAAKITELKTIVDQIKSGLNDKYLTVMKSVSHAFGEPMGDNPFAGACLYLNHLLCEELKEKGFDAHYVGGAVFYGFNKTPTGNCNYGYVTQEQMAAFKAMGLGIDDLPFMGHAWVEIPSLNVIVDLTLMHLESVIADDNKANGLPPEKEFLIDSEKLVLELSELITPDDIWDFNTGCSYIKTDSITHEAKRRSALMLEKIGFAELIHNQGGPEAVRVQFM